MKAILKLGEEYGVDLPICKSVYGVLYENADMQATLDSLFRRDTKCEF